jgi:hypothetical protein
LSVRLAVTSCSSSTWISDVTVMCRNAAGGGSVRGVTASVELLVSKTILIGNGASGPLFSVAFVGNMLKSATPWTAENSALFTGGIQIIVNGENFGLIDVSFGMRIGGSSTCATLWLSETSTTNRVGQRSNGLNSLFGLSANSLQSSTKLTPDHLYMSFQIISVTPRNISRTGSSVMTLFGAHFALHSNTAALRAGQSSQELSFWQADSIVSCKSTASGLDFHSFIVFSLAYSAPLLAFRYALSASISPLQVSSTLESFPSDEIQDLGKTILVSILGEQFGKSNSIEVVEFDGKVQGPSMWISDSSLLCSIPILHFQSNRVEIILKSRKTTEVTNL